jgi:uncharacterized protein YjbJ (UPF0337 family)
MDSNKFEGTVRDLSGKAEDAVGGLTGDTKTQMRGKVDQAVGQTQRAIGDAADTVRDFASDQPIGAVLLAAGIGFIAGLLLARR